MNCVCLDCRFLLSAYASEGLMRMNRLSEAGHYLSVSYINNVFRQMNADLDKEGRVSLQSSQATTTSSSAAGAAANGTPQSASVSVGISSSRSSEDLNNSNADEPANQYERPGAVIKCRSRPLLPSIESSH